MCRENKVDYYPKLVMFVFLAAQPLVYTVDKLLIRRYADGLPKEEYKGNRELDDLNNFTDRHIRAYVHTARPAPPAAPAVNHTITTTTSTLNPLGQVLALDSTTFPTTLSTGPTFVKFFAPWLVARINQSQKSLSSRWNVFRCGHCQKLAPGKHEAR
jgi:hypothetical protein